MATKQIEVKVKQLETKEDKRKFNVYKGVSKDGTLIDVKFTREVKTLPTEDSMIEVDTNDMNIAKNRVYPVIWIKKVISITPMKDLLDNSADQAILDEMF